MSSNNFRHLGAGDPPHFDYKGPGATDVRSLSVRAFQSLWNKNNPNDRIPVDGSYTPAVETRLLRSPANGFSGGNNNNDNNNNNDLPPPRNDFAPPRNGPSCSPRGLTGVCVNTDNDPCTGGTLYRGFCPGGNNSVCCVSRSSRATAPDNTVLASQTPVIIQNTVYIVVIAVVGVLLLAGLGGTAVLVGQRMQSLSERI
jgi:hypothetical protein